ncbi:glycosyltransferase family 4 protein [Paracoccus shanxieyensis]|uniref:Glycosyltransferase n=1 Tax=Paracoccus shanxieyensis TaxID=2675752 RepID=A0A6L6IWR4_9RHOB|nr:glycosyltransferase family 1 protein [Paracoccus shanxieyensis]MTH62797.1 glycosyltransferase [Paracoccus shanxieyensis]MTH86119.1 glycosyltransferase [Paracoccus shanxieyensis]
MPPEAILLDVSRLISRLDQGPATGIDRVEAEWLAHLNDSGTPHLLLARVRRAQLVLPPEAGRAILRWGAGRHADLPCPDLIDRLRGRRDIRARAEAALRRMALYRADRAGRGVAKAAVRRLGPSPVYLNIGHSNLTDDLWAGLADLRRAVLIHDTIPLDFPQFTRAGQTQKFKTRFAAALSHADLVLTVSEATRQDALRWRDALALPDVPVVAAPIGTRLAAPDASGLPALDLARPFFVTLGTIEPRKNHALLLDAWDRLGPDAPQLFIIGRRGWENHQTFARLDSLPQDGPIRVLSTLDDGAVAELLTRSHGLLLPSRAEGFGLPLTEAAGRGIPVLCAPLPAATELLGDYAQYLSPDDPAAWAKAVVDLAKAAPQRKSVRFVPQWDAHFAHVQLMLQERLHV